MIPPSDLSKPVSGTFHEYASRLTAFEFGNLNSKKVLIFIGGLGDGFLTVPYVPPMAKELEKLGWTTIQILFQSSYIGWGSGSLARDSSDINKLVEYLKSDTGGNRETIVLMGHSTGCQNTVHYLSKSGFGDSVDGGIVQASVSDREAMVGIFGSAEGVEESAKFAKSLIDAGKPDEWMPTKYTDKFFGAPINAYRWHSLASVRGDDDFFSSDLTSEDNAETFGKIKKPFLIAFSGKDEFVPDFVDRVALVEKFKKATDPKYLSKYSGIIEGALHNVGTQSAPNSVTDLISMVKGFLEDLL